MEKGWKNRVSVISRKAHLRYLITGYKYIKGPYKDDGDQLFSIEDKCPLKIKQVVTSLNCNKEALG